MAFGRPSQAPTIFRKSKQAGNGTVQGEIHWGRIWLAFQELQTWLVDTTNEGVKRTKWTSWATSSLDDAAVATGSRGLFVLQQAAARSVVAALISGRKRLPKPSSPRARAPGSRAGIGDSRARRSDIALGDVCSAVAWRAALMAVKSMIWAVMAVPPSCAIAL